MVGQTSLVITWKTDTTAITCHVEYFPKNATKSKIAKGNLVFHEGNYFNEVHISGLSPDTKYGYQIFTNGFSLVLGEKYFFETAPSKSKPFSFYALGDIGAKERNSFAKEPAARITELEVKPDFGLGLGDIVYPKGESKNYDNHLFKPFQNVFINTPFYPVAGNHDWLNKNYDKNFKKEWCLPNNEHYYHFEYANTLFVGLDSRDGNFYDLSNQTGWLENVLKENKDKYEWIVVYLHHNGKSCTYKKDYKHVKDLYQVFSNHSVDIVLNGHAHTYERLKPYDENGNIVTSRTDQSKYEKLENEFISITLGAGGKLNRKWKAAPNDSSNCPNGNIVAHSEHVGSFGLISIDGKTMTFKGINSFTGEVFDEFTVLK